MREEDTERQREEASTTIVINLSTKSNERNDEKKRRYIYMQLERERESGKEKDSNPIFSLLIKDPFLSRKIDNNNYDYKSENIVLLHYVKIFIV